ncbi:hypothetical protein BURK1_02574 [Burkholderiales bacterium]|nr:hypothetical protein BURK1_02574 [Burkholderiales bacterium]
MSPRTRRDLLSAVAACALAACAGPAPPMASDGAVPPIVLLGEVHDNADGHARRFARLKAQVEAGWRPAVAMEQFDRERQADLDRAASECADAACVIRLAGAPGGLWDWEHYEPVIALSLAHRLPLKAANLSRAEAARVVREGFRTAFDAATIEAFGLDRALPRDLADGQRRAIEVGHCDRLPPAVAERMVLAQVARDVWMAKVVSEAAAPRGVVLLAGNGHVRRDLGVPRWLGAVGVARARSVGYLEEPADGEYDERVAIAPQAREDPCANVPLRREP